MPIHGYMQQEGKKSLVYISSHKVKSHIKGIYILPSCYA